LDIDFFAYFNKAYFTKFLNMLDTFYFQEYRPVDFFKKSYFNSQEFEDMPGKEKLFVRYTYAKIYRFKKKVRVYRGRWAIPVLR